MPFSTPDSSYHKLQTDHSISQAYKGFGSNDIVRKAFRDILSHVRVTAPSILSAPYQDGYHPGVRALTNLARFSMSFLRPITEWNGSNQTWRVAINDLAQFLLAKYPVPRFLGSVWYHPNNIDSEQWQHWYISYGSGSRFRAIDLPIKMTRRMEHIFLQSHDHMEIAYAMRRAELLGLGLPGRFVNAILSTRLGTDLRFSSFWRTVWHFLHANATHLPSSYVVPLVEFIFSIRQETMTVLTSDGEVHNAPSHPEFSMKGRTVTSLLHLMDKWQANHDLSSGTSWTKSSIRPVTIEEPPADPSKPPNRWIFVELLNSIQLSKEGRTLKHCVASYSRKCRNNISRIWSLRQKRGTKERSIVTIEINPRRRAIVQAKGLYNCNPTLHQKHLIQTWADREGIRMLI